jgi:hypothetical protein
VAWNKIPLVGFSFATAACYAYVVGIPLLIAVPLGVVLGTVIAGYIPIYMSTIVIPVAMLGYYYVLPTSFQVSELANLVLAAIALLPAYIGIVSGRRYIEEATIPSALGHACLALLPVWFAVSFSSNHIRDAVAFAIVIFWFVIPLQNAIWDSISWWFTWRLLTHLQSALCTLNEETGNPGSVVVRMVLAARRLCILFGHILVNFFVSAIMLIVTFAMIMMSLTAVNFVIKSVRPQYVVDVPQLLRAVQDEPYAGDGLWMVLAVVSTLIPALVHLSIVFLSAFVMAVGPLTARNAWKVLQKSEEQLTEAEASRAVRTAALYIATSVFFFSVCVIMALRLYRVYGGSGGAGGIMHSIGLTAMRAVTVVVGR